MKSKNKIILISFDVEEFDTPLEYGCDIDFDKQMKLSTEGLANLEKLFNSIGSEIVCTYYTTANYLKYESNILKRLSIKNEIASHSFYHSSFSEDHILESKMFIESIINKEVYGFRMPRLSAFNKALLKKSNYVYDSSINPTFIPGRYNHLNKPIKPFSYFDIIEIPTSVMPYFRIPLFWLSFKNIPLKLYLKMCDFTLNTTGILHLYFHPWEFADIDKTNIPNYIKKPNGLQLIQKLKTLLLYYLKKRNAKFITTIDFIKNFY